MTLMSCCVQYVRIFRIHHNIGHARVFPLGQDEVPIVSTVFGAVQTPLATGRPKRTLRSDKDDIRIAWVDQDLANVFRFPEPFHLPSTARVVAHVNAIAETDVTSTVVFASANPDGRARRRVDRNAPNRIGFLAIKDRLKCRSGVTGFPNSPGSNSDVPSVWILLIYRNVADPPRHKRRPNTAELESSCQHPCIDRLVFLFLSVFTFLLTFLLLRVIFLGRCRFVCVLFRLLLFLSRLFLTSSRLFLLLGLLLLSKSWRRNKEKKNQSKTNHRCIPSGKSIGRFEQLEICETNFYRLESPTAAGSSKETLSSSLGNKDGSVKRKTALQAGFSKSPCTLNERCNSNGNA